MSVKGPLVVSSTHIGSMYTLRQDGRGCPHDTTRPSDERRVDFHRLVRHSNYELIYRPDYITYGLVV